MASSIIQIAKTVASKLGLRRRKSYYTALLSREVTTSRMLMDGFARVGIQAGDAVFVHAALSKFGAVNGGPATVIECLLNTVGPLGTIAMPSFPFSGSMQEYVSANPVFDARHTPSASGALTEAFRVAPGTLRSSHPTHPVIAQGKDARYFIEADSSTPCGVDSPFGRLQQVNAKVLRLGTGALTLYHHVQELVQYPNLFLDDPVQLRCIDMAGVEQIRETRVYRAGIPNLLWVDVHGDRVAIHPSNWPVLFPGDRQAKLGNHPALGRLLEFRQSLAASGLWAGTEINGCSCDSLTVSAYIDLAEREYREQIQRFREYYSLEYLESLLRARDYPRK